MKSQCHTAKNRSWKLPSAQNSLLVDIDRLSSITVSMYDYVDT